MVVKIQVEFIKQMVFMFVVWEGVCIRIIGLINYDFLVWGVIIYILLRFRKYKLQD